MASSLSKDLRRRVVDAYSAGKGTYREVAELFGVGEASVSRWLRLHRERGDVAPEPHRGGNPPRVARDEYSQLRELVAEKPDRTVDELRKLWQARFGSELSRSSMQRALVKAGLTWKKNGSARPSRLARESSCSAPRS